MSGDWPPCSPDRELVHRRIGRNAAGKAVLQLSGGQDIAVRTPPAGAIRPVFSSIEDIMIISQGSTVTITYTLTLESGETVESSTDGEPLTYTHGEEQLLAGLEQALAGKKAGDSFRVSIQPEDGYGAASQDALIEVPLSHVPEEARQSGSVLTAVGPQGEELQGVVSAIGETTATVDFNHPLAGQVLHCEVTVLRVE
ncbi:MAG: peptidylprolyl isomerase [Desulfobulbus sp.]|nr:peptidylprolyl isomerase [Desulfobulbus sp.]